MNDPAGALQAALTHHRAGRLAEAETAYRELLSAEPANSDALNLMGVLAHQLGRSEIALEWLTRALAARPDHPLAYANLGNVQLALGRTEAAVAAYETARALSPKSPDAHASLGSAYAAAGRYDAAIAAFEEVVRLNPTLAEAQSNLAALLRAVGNFEASASAARAALALRPDSAEAYGNLALALHGLRRYEEAIAAYRQAIRIKPDVAAMHANLSAAAESLGAYDEALAASRRAIELAPASAQAHNNLGAALTAKHELPQAIASYEEAIRLQPGFAEAHRNLSFTHLLSGDFRAGWEHYAWRTRVANRSHEFARLQAIAPWDGTAFAGRTLLVAAEQGLGDCILLARYLPEVKALGGTVVLECPRELRRLFAHVAGFDRFLEDGEPLTAQRFDLVTSIATLPQFFTADVASIPVAQAYLHADPSEIAVWKERIKASGKAFNVGIVWGGGTWNINDRYRSCTLADFMPLANLKDVALFSLQKGPRELEALEPPPGMTLAHLGEELRDFADTAAALHALDLTIAVDTAIVHLAGALGRPVWNILAFNAYWIWLLDRDDSPWYPSMRLFRQSSPGDWRGVFEKVAVALAQRS